MSGAAGHHDGSAGAWGDAEELAREAVGGAADQLSRAASGAEPDLQLLAPVMEVSRRYAGRSLTDEGVATDMVAAMLADTELASLPEGVRRTLADRVGVVLLTDPSTHLRLERLWNALARVDR